MRNAASDLRIAKIGADVGPAPIAVRFGVFQHVIEMRMDRLFNSNARHHVREIDDGFLHPQRVALRTINIVEFIEE